ncbi:MAG TPA: penicillin-binding transpeptidase domain-containing protein [Planctomycetota bacterium]|nr:penicillin-binding transpeptidase domain-containing protein [Planctomycetota bacterium]
MSTSGTRIGVIASCLLAGFCIVLGRLWFLMVHDNDVWTRRSQENRWSFRSVPAKRGALLDRHGHVLVQDAPTTQLEVYYLRFRRDHPVGAAVHAATLWAGLQAGREGTTYSYLDGALGPEQALREVLAIPSRAFRKGVLEKQVRGNLAYVATTVLAACSGHPRKRVFGALRESALQQGARPIGDVLTVPRADLEQAFARCLASLQQLDRDVLAEARARGERLGQPDGQVTGLFDLLETLRRQSLAGARVEWVDQEGNTQQGSLTEAVRRAFAKRVPFELAASLRIGAEQHPGLEVSPSIERIHAEPEGTSLRALLGRVVELDRIERRSARGLPEDWLDELVPSGTTASAEDREWLQEDAKQVYERELLRRERSGTTGLEAAFDDELTGRLGLRFVEHDRQRREQLLWSNLRVESGEDLRLTFDQQLQQAAEDAVRAAWRRERDRFSEEKDQGHVEAAIAVLDASSGDVLAYAGAPLVTDWARDVPGVVWRSNGSIGSVIKPFVLVEQLQSELVGRQHRPSASFDGCSGRMRFGNTTLHCSHAHWDGGKSPVTALSESCNVYFYQSGIGLEEEGLARALRRFGLMRPAEADPFAACWQDDVRGIGVARPIVDTEDTVLPRRAVGYGVAASPLSVARAYAALATGALPTVGLELGVVRPRVQLDGIEAELDVVRQGMRACVQSGTARRLDLWNDFQVHGKTGTAGVTKRSHNNAWFAGYLPWTGRDGAQICFCAVVYWVQEGVHGGEAAGELVAHLLKTMRADAELNARYLQPVGGR